VLCFAIISVHYLLDYYRHPPGPPPIGIGISTRILDTGRLPDFTKTPRPSKSKMAQLRHRLLMPYFRSQA